MTTQAQKDKKIAAAQRVADDVTGKLTKARERLANLEQEYAATKESLAAKITALEPEARVATEHVEWVKAMPVSGSAAGEVGAVATPEADSTEE